jgi:hypothetical protein
LVKPEQKNVGQKNVDKFYGLPPTAGMMIRASGGYDVSEDKL